MAWNSKGSPAGTLLRPLGVAVDDLGLVFVVDSGNDRIVVSGDDGTLLCSWGMCGKSPGQFRSPRGIAVHPAAGVYVADFANVRVQRFASDESACV